MLKSLAAFVICFNAQAPDVDAEFLRLEKMRDEVSRSTNWQDRAKGLVEVNKGVFALIEKDRLTNAGEFARASALITPNNFWFEDQRVSYELALCALALDPATVVDRWAVQWDSLLMGMARHPRLGGFEPMPAGMDDPRFRVEWAPQSILDVIGKRRNPPKSGADNAELIKMRADDQAARNFDFTKVKDEDLRKMMSDDRRRQARVREMLDEGLIRTGRDFEAASLIMQHGGRFADYLLAHELSVSAVALGYKEAIWLLSRTYDRMLLSAGYRSRLVTQYDGLGLSQFDPANINDRMRTILKSKPLSEAIKAGKNLGLP